MRWSLSTSFCAVFAVGLSLAGSAVADETGLAGMHAWQKAGSKTCMVDHEHDGSGSGATPQLAMREAVKAWESFTDLEYGSDWASYANSIGKKVSCGRNISDVSCQITSRACRGGVLTKTAARPAKKRAVSR